MKKLYKQNLKLKREIDLLGDIIFNLINLRGYKVYSNAFKFDLSKLLCFDYQPISIYQELAALFLRIDERFCVGGY